MALLIYSGTGCACVLVLALRVALRPDPAPDTEIRPPARLRHHAAARAAASERNSARMSRSGQRFAIMAGQSCIGRLG